MLLIAVRPRNFTIRCFLQSLEREGDYMVRPGLLVLRWAVRLRELSEQVWERRQVGFALVLAGAIICSYWLFRIPAPGYAVAVMGVAAALMAARTKASGYEKAGWMLVMFGLLFVETIRKDRLDNEWRQEQAHKEQKQNFTDIGVGLKAAIKESQQQFSATMSNIDTTLKTSERTLKNTLPYAALEFQQMTPYGPSLPIAVGQELEFNLWFTNSGTDTATRTHHEAKVYVRRPDNVEDEKQIANDFDEQWKRSTHSKANDIRPHAPAFFSFKSEPITDSEVKGVLGHTLTLYVLVRFTWSDQTGNWIGAECFSFQDATHDLIVGHQCHFHKSRYRAN
jgi:hypothetical protein